MKALEVSSHLKQLLKYGCTCETLMNCLNRVSPCWHLVETQNIEENEENILQFTLIINQRCGGQYQVWFSKENTLGYFSAWKDKKINCYQNDKFGTIKWSANVDTLFD
jgi:hypothetical protein